MSYSIPGRIGKGFCINSFYQQRDKKLEKYCFQLDKLKTAVQQKSSKISNWKGVLFHQDNSRPHDNSTRVVKLGFDILLLSRYSLNRKNFLVEI